MFKTPPEIAAAIGSRIRKAAELGWGQAEAAKRAGVAYRTWRRMEAEGKASIDDIVRAAIALRCEQRLKDIFPEPVAKNMEDLLDRRRSAEGTAKRRVRAPRRTAS